MANSEENSMIQVFDDVLPDPHAYRAEVLKMEYRSYDFGHCVFHGIAVGPPSEQFIEIISKRFPGLTKTLTFFRKSPLGQVEPHWIHSDVDMGDWSCILYLNPNPPAGDGTCFWTHLGTGCISSDVPHERSEEGRKREGWHMREHVQSKFNRALLFPSNYFHSRAIYENHGEGEDARLVQVVFGKGQIT